MNVRDLITRPFDLLASAARTAAGGGDDVPRQMNFAGSVEIRAAAAPGDGDGEGDGADRIPSFVIDAYDGGLLYLDGFFVPVVAELKGITARRTIKALREHDRTRIVGHAPRSGMTVTDDGVQIAGVMSGDQEEIDRIMRAEQRGFPWEASIGARIASHEFIERGDEVTVNGKTFEGPLLVARETIIAEVSFVSIGAAEKTSASIAAGHGTDTDKETAMTFEQWLQANGWGARKDLSEGQLATLQAAYQVEMNAASPAGDDGGESDADGTPPSGSNQNVNASAQRGGQSPGAGQAGRTASGDAGDVEDPRLSIRAEYARIGQVRSICARHSNPTIEVNGQPVDLEAHAIEQGWDAEKTELQALRASRHQGPYVNVGSTNGAPANAQVIEAAICLSAQCSQEFLGRHYTEQTLNAALEGNMNNFGLQRLVYACLAANGGYYTPGLMDNATIQAALRTDPALNGMHIQASGFSTLSLSGILSNVANKYLLEQFEMGESVVSDIAYETDVPDFKAFTHYRLDTKDGFSEVGKDGELKHIELAEDSYSNQLATHGGLFMITRQDFINDDLGAIMRLPMILVQLALTAREQITFTKLLANAGSFFSANNGNFIDGADTVLSIDGLNLGVKAFRNLKNAAGHPIMVRPDRVLVPPAIEGTAKQLYQSTELNETTSANKAKGKKNIHAGMFNPLVSPWLGTDYGLSGSSDTAWYLLPNPRTGRAVVQLGYLRGQNRRPVIETGQPDFDKLGLGFRGYYDFGAALFDKKAGVKSKGAA